MPTPTTPESTDRGSNFIRAIVEADNAAGTYDGHVYTRFPPEPNGFLHIGHAKSIALNFGLAQDYGGTCNLRFDDTNPSTEDVRYVQSIQADLRWLGFQPAGVYYASDYYEELYRWAEELIVKGLAYVCPLNDEEIRVWRGTVTEPGRDSPGRANSVARNLDLFRRMRAGEFPDGAMTLRARIDNRAANMKMRDPLLYRIRHAHHYRTGDAWCIYPMYDFAHPLSDAIEGITHSICTLEFENNRDIYDWLIENCSVPARPRQIEFARLSLTYTVMSKRKLLELVTSGLVSGWDDPRMPTLAGLRRRGVTPSALRDFAERIGVAKANSTVEIELFENCLRDDLNTTAPRVLAVLRPLRVTIEGWDADKVDWLDAPYWPHDVPREGSRKVPFTRELYIERDDFQEQPEPGFHRLRPGGEVRLRYGYILRCEGVDKDASGQIVALRCSLDPDSRGGQTKDGRTVKGTIHWVSATHALPCEFRLYDRLFSVKNPGVGTDGADWKSELNPDSLSVSSGWIEPSVAQDPAETRYQFERTGYFWRDPTDSSADKLIFNRIIPLRDSRPSARAEAKPAAKVESPKVEATAPAKPRSQPELSAEQRGIAEGLEARGLGAEDARMLAQDADLRALFEAADAVASDPKAVANWACNALIGEAKGRAVVELPITGAALGRLIVLVREGTLATPAAKDVLAELVRDGGDPDAIVAARGLQRLSDTAALQTIVDAVIAENPAQAAAVRAGKTGMLGFFVGATMKRTQGRADPKIVSALLQKALG